MDNKIKVVWVCHFSNNYIRGVVYKSINPIIRLIRKIVKGVVMKETDYAIWVTNAIVEFEQFKNIELHIVFPNGYITKKALHFDKNGVYYHCFRSEQASFKNRIKRLLGIKVTGCTNSNIINKLVKVINPDIVHYIGAENPDYSLAILDTPVNIPTIVQLQTLLMDACSNGTRVDNGILKCEYEVISRADYVATPATKYVKYLNKNMSNKLIIKTVLALAENVTPPAKDNEILYDFVYFASNISKAADLAIEAFAEAYKYQPSITLDIVGGFDITYKQQLDNRIQELGIEEAIIFEGSLPTHEDVVKQIRKSRYALLPLKIDLLSGTIRESMSNGLPVVTTITDGTPQLNTQRETLLLSPIGDAKLMADNMLRLLNDQELQNKLRANGYSYMSQLSSNANRMKKWVEAYYACINHYHNSVPIPESLIL